MPAAGPLLQAVDLASYHCCKVIDRLCYTDLRTLGSQRADSLRSCRMLLLYVQIEKPHQVYLRDGGPRTATSTFTQLLSVILNE